MHAPRTAVGIASRPATSQAPPGRTSSVIPGVRAIQPRRRTRFISLDPMAAARIGRMVIHEPASPGVQGLLVRALVAAGTPAAQQALAEALTLATLHHGAEESALIGLSFLDRPTDRAQAALEALVDLGTEQWKSQQALMGLGAFARAVAPQDSHRARRIVETLKAQEARSGSIEWRVACLEALGNAGDRDAFERVLAYAADANEIMRGTAIGAVRFMDHAAADDLLRRGLADESSYVRSRTAETLPLPGTEAAAKLLLEASWHPDPEVRRIVLRWHASRVDVDPEARRVVEQMSANDPDEDLRRDTMESLLAAEELAR